MSLVINRFVSINSVGGVTCVTSCVTTNYLCDYLT